MNKKRIIIIAGIAAVVLIIGGVVLVQTKGTNTSSKLQNVDAVTFTADTAGSASDALDFEAEADGTETATTQTVSSEAQIYNKPSGDASVLATLASGTSISVLGQVDGGQWVKVVYNGRVAYVQASVLGTDNDTTNNSTTNANRNNTTTNSNRNNTSTTTNNNTTQSTGQGTSTGQTTQPTTPTTPTTPTEPSTPAAGGDDNSGDQGFEAPEEGN